MSWKTLCDTCTCEPQSKGSLTMQESLQSATAKAEGLEEELIQEQQQNAELHSSLQTERSRTHGLQARSRVLPTL
jgi:hypothetical protein